MATASRASSHPYRATRSLQAVQSVAPLPRRSPSPVPSSPTQAPQGRKVVPLSPSPAPVRSLPASRSLPLWLRFLMLMQRSSQVTVLVLAMAVVLMYGSIVYMQQRWSKEFDRLKVLQGQERKMVIQSEFMKNDLAKQAESPQSGLVPRTPQGVLFVPAAPKRPQKPEAPASKPEAPSSAPIGY